MALNWAWATIPQHSWRTLKSLLFSISVFTFRALEFFLHFSLPRLFLSTREKRNPIWPRREIDLLEKLQMRPRRRFVNERGIKELPSFSLRAQRSTTRKTAVPVNFDSSEKKRAREKKFKEMDEHEKVYSGIFFFSQFYIIGGIFVLNSWMNWSKCNWFGLEKYVCS